MKDSMFVGLTKSEYKRKLSKGQRERFDLLLASGYKGEEAFNIVKSKADTSLAKSLGQKKRMWNNKMSAVEFVLESADKLYRYDEMANIISDHTGIETDKEKYCIVFVPMTTKHSNRIKMSIFPDNTVSKDSLITIYFNTDTYFIIYNNSIRKDVLKAKDGIRLAVAYYNKNKNKIDEYINKMGSSERIQPEEIFVKTLQKVTPEDVKDFRYNIEYIAK